MQLRSLELESDIHSGDLKCFLPVPPAAFYLLPDAPSKLFIRDSYTKLADIVLSGSLIPWSDILGIVQIACECLRH